MIALLTLASAVMSAHAAVTFHMSASGEILGQSSSQNHLVSAVQSVLQPCNKGGNGCLPWTGLDEGSVPVDISTFASKR